MMSWETTTATFTILGRDQTVLRAGFIIEIYGDERLKDVGLELFEELHGWIPEDRKLFMLGKRSQEYKELTPRRLSRLRKTLGALATEGQFYAVKDGEGFEVGEYGIELSISDSMPTRVFVNLPLSFVREREDEAFESFRALVDRFPVVCATAGYGFNLEWARAGEQKGQPVEIRKGLRYHGLNLRNRAQEMRLGKKLKSVHWLTFIDDERVEESGAEHRFEAIGDGVEVHRVDGGVVLRAGAAPPIGDINHKAPDLAPMKAVNDALQSIRIDAWDPATLSLFAIDTDDANSWVTRMD